MKPDAVIKVGGSLLDWPGLPAALATYLQKRAGERLVLIVGGGAAADMVRTLDALHGLGEERAHHLALRALEFTAHALAAMVAGLCVAEQTTEISEIWTSGRTPLLAPRRFLDEDEAMAHHALPHTWDVTTDAIAARVAERLGARQLVLLKSAPLPHKTPRAEAAQMGLVDRHFPIAAERLEEVLYVNLREPGTAPCRLERFP